MEILVIYKRLWYLYPKGKYGYNSYYTVIKNLIFKVEKDRALVDKFNKLYPKLLYARKIMPSDRRSLNERKQCLLWLKKNSEYRLVQDSFKYLNVQSLEDKCSEENVLPQISKPTIREQECIDILENCIKELFMCFLEIESLPICNVIRNIDASVSGYASLIDNKEKKKNIYNYTYRYKINSICIKEYYLKNESFTSALTVFLHELCHTFGGDKSESFSYALTEALRIVISNPQAVEKYKVMWEAL